MKKIKIIICSLLALLIMTDYTFADDSAPFFDQSHAAALKTFPRAAVVGKVIHWNEEAQVFIVYGRLSADAGLGWKVYQTGMFFPVKPDPAYSNIKEKIESLVSEGKGIKAFGKYHSGFDTEAELLAKEIEEYDPSLDATVGLESAYTGLEENWLGLGLHRQLYNSHLTAFKKTTDWVNLLYPFKEALKYGGRILVLEKDIPHYKNDAPLSDVKEYENAVLFDVNQKQEYYAKDLVPAFRADVYRDDTPDIIPNASREEHRKFLQELRKVYPYPNNIYYLIKDLDIVNQSLSAVYGTLFVKAHKGIGNSLLREIPVIRPDIDDYMEYVENQTKNPSEDISRWATPALFYGAVTPVYRMELQKNGTYKEVYDHAIYTTPYFEESRPQELIETIIDYSNPNYQGVAEDITDESDKYRDVEVWRFGWEGEGYVLGLTEEQALHFQNHGYTWGVGTRTLVYRVAYNPPEPAKPSVSYPHVTHGNMEDQVKNPPPYTTVSYVGCYIKHDKFITKGEMNFTLDAIREYALNGI